MYTEIITEGFRKWEMNLGGRDFDFDFDSRRGRWKDG